MKDISLMKIRSRREKENGYDFYFRDFNLIFKDILSRGLKFCKLIKLSVNFI